MTSGIVTHGPVIKVDERLFIFPSFRRTEIVRRFVGRPGSIFISKAYISSAVVPSLGIVAFQTDICSFRMADLPDHATPLTISTVPAIQ